jgi:hypothetical protein
MKARARGTPRIKPYVGDCRRCEAANVLIRSSYGLCAECYPEVQAATQMDYYPRIWTIEQAREADTKTRGAVWRRTRKLLRYSFGMTTLAEWLEVKPIALHVNEADERLLVAAVRILGYLGWLTSRRAEDEFREVPVDRERIARLVQQAFSSE